MWEGGEAHRPLGLFFWRNRVTGIFFLGDSLVAETGVYYRPLSLVVPMRAHALLVLAGIAAVALTGVGAFTTSVPTHAGAAVRLLEKAAKAGKHLPKVAPRTALAAKALADAAPAAKVAASVVGVATVEGMVRELGLLSPIVSSAQAEKIVGKWILDAAQEAASKPNSGVTVGLLDGTLRVDGSRTVAGVTITGGEINVYELGQKIVVGCGLTDVAAHLLLQAQGCIMTLFGLG
jgi:hypothetical protein